MTNKNKNMHEPSSADALEPNQPDQTVEQEPEGLDPESDSWGDYPLDDLLIRDDRRTVHDVLRRINRGTYVMNPDFQRDFIWPEDKQSKLIESVIMRIPLPVFYTAEDSEGRMIVVDGLQRLSTFRNFVNDELRLRLPARQDLNGKRFSDLSPKFQNRIEDCNLIFYVIDSRAPERARLDIFERVNGGEPLTRQQMRNSLFMGPATTFLKEEAQTDIFLRATGRSLNWKTMRDREFVNRFCAFQLLDLNGYRGDMDDYLARSLSQMNKLDETDLCQLSMSFRKGLSNNLNLFGRHAFRKSFVYPSLGRSVINASFWDVMSTGLSPYSEAQVESNAIRLREAIRNLLRTNEFDTAITYGTSATKRVRSRFRMTDKILKEILGAHAN